MTELSFLDYFEELEDPRVERTKFYPVDEILLTTLCAVICGSEGWSDVELFGKYFTLSWIHCTLYNIP